MRRARALVATIAIGGCNFGGPGSSTPVDDGGTQADTVDAVISLPLSSPRKLVFQNMASDKDLVSFPVLVPLDPTRIDYGKVTNPATQLRFHDPDTDTDLPFDIEKWDPAGESLVWVRVPTITKNKNSDFILMFFGSDANGTENKANVWTSYELVTHLGTGTIDVSNHSHDGVGLGASPGVTDAKIADGQVFAGTGDSRIVFGTASGLFSGWTEFTLELWLRVDYPTLADVIDNAGVIGRGGPLDNGRIFRPTTTSLSVEIDFHFNDNGPTNDAFLSAPIELGAWTYVVYTYDGTKLRLYTNGVKVKEEDHPRQLNNDSRSLFLGDTGTPFKGVLDEMRVTQTKTEAAWIDAQYRAMQRQFIQFTDP